VPQIPVGEDEFVELDEQGNPRRKAQPARAQRKPAPVRRKPAPRAALKVAPEADVDTEEDAEPDAGGRDAAR
jgi:small subunit ribosomal protein S2